ncbi:HAD family hydrolase [Paenibacillus sp. CGMCC 1.16610]|uniref:HAD hydrolase-like protein n=1 Tax=Paenibacillus anseongense TaxID=2682845 RepID=A0ABW9U8M5_9BACL|nr:MULTISPECIES: HAD family hydrolase [Paenibacillus]MBA2942562.1 HAD family hydrolase [Paenibacillus sp. CGMCC 1.16610]MVQ35376.1 HAD hydrolase-like protein [Paenibacillus anseongense]
MDWLHEIEVILFDLDGTLYQDGTFYKRYLELLFQEGDYAASLDEILEEMERLLAGRDTSRIGDWYHPSTDTWTRVTPGDVSELSQQNWNTPAIYAGDAWSLVSMFTVKHGIGEAKRQEAFQQVRKEMLQGSSSFERHAGLYEAIRQLSGVRSKLLLTNSPENTGREFIAALGAGELFTDIKYGAGKPAGLEHFMSELMEREGLRPEQILSIGDHAWNDLYPVRKLGGRTAWISAYSSSDPSPWDVRLTTLDELASLLMDIQDSKLKHD